MTRHALRSVIRRGRSRAKPGGRRLQIEGLEPRQLLAAEVLITEFMASNSGGLRDGDGDSSDWIELFNAGDVDVDLGGYFLTDEADELSKWPFPAGTIIGSGATLLVFASDKGSDGPAGELHTSFGLLADGEYLALVEPDGETVVHDYSPEFPQQQTNVSYGLSMTSSTTTLVDDTTSMMYWVPTSGIWDATWHTLAFTDSSWTPETAGLGYENTPGGLNDYTSLIDATVPPGTTSTYARFKFNVANPEEFNTLQLDMIYDDGFVAYLNGQLIAMENQPANPAWDSAAGSINRGDEVVLADYVGYDVTDHLNALQAGENVLAIHALNQASSSDMLMIPRFTAGTAQVVEPFVEGVLAKSTPGAPNGQVHLGVVQDTTFSVDRGFYSAPFEVEISTPTSDATIVYTTNGSAPAVDENLNVTNGSLYTGPIQITGTTNLRAAAFKIGFVPTNVDTQTYIFTSDVIQQTHQSALSAGFPSTWGSRAADYGLDPDVIGPNDLFGGIYAALIEDSLKAIPTISLTLDNADFFGPAGIYTNITGSGIPWERPASAELIFPDGSEGFQIDAGLRIHGAASRVLSKKNSLRLLFKDEYGDSKLEYPLFGAEGVAEFDTIVLRPHFNDGWGWDGAGGDPLFIRDQWFRDTQAVMGHASSRGNVVHLYINGLYWGLYNPSDRPDDSFAAEHFGGDKDEYDVVNHDGLHSGTLDAYNTMLSLAQAVNSAGGIAAKNAAYQRLQGNLASGADDPASEAFLDVVNYIDYMILNHYGGNNDWPDRNWFSNRRRGADSDGFRFFAWDSEISLALSSRTSILENNLGKVSGAAQAFGILRNYEEFRLQFADRIHHHLFNSGALYVNPASPTYNPASPQNNLPASRFAALADTVYEAIVAESARWGDQHVSFPRTRNIDWQNELNYMLGTYFRDRHDIVLNQWRQANLYPATNAPEFLIDGSRMHGGVIPADAEVGFQNTNTGSPGVIYFTTDGSDPRLVGGAVNSASAQAYSSEIPLTETTHVKARILRNGQWSALSEATFMRAAVAGDYDRNGIVDTLDYQVWTSNFASTATNAADGNNDGEVNAADYVIWKAAEAASAQLAADAFAEIHASGSSNSEPVLPADLQDGAPNQAAALRGSFSKDIAPRASVHSFIKPAIRPMIGSGSELEDQNYDDGLLAWVAQLDEKRNVTESREACMTESKASRRSDDFRKDSHNTIIGLLASSHSETFRTF
ncbi:MAG TPA: chitobiase/beta-hexosaminidase C-terminal domain-containing protein [Lacipirellulaceae bacterium]|nr:chitobiase/beta-hexosaminidase C-terminal domain-containing protein [Lacipirellulaceae bacterium]